MRLVAHQDPEREEQCTTTTKRATRPMNASPVADATGTRSGSSARRGSAAIGGEAVVVVAATLAVGGVARGCFPPPRDVTCHAISPSSSAATRTAATREGRSANRRRRIRTGATTAVSSGGANLLWYSSTNRCP